MFRDFILGVILAISTWIALAVLSLSVYRYTGNWGLLMAHPYQWSLAISFASIIIDALLCKKLGLKWR